MNHRREIEDVVKKLYIFLHYTRKQLMLLKTKKHLELNKNVIYITVSYIFNKHTL